MSDNILNSALKYIADNMIVESGTSNGWTYKKWPDNTIIAWRYFDAGSVAEYATWNNMHAYNVQNIPTPFKMANTQYVVSHDWRIGNGHSIPSTINVRNVNYFGLIGLSSAASPANITLDIVLFGEVADEEE